MATYSLRNERLTPAQAWHVMSKAARDPEILAHGLHIQGGEEAIALLYHAAGAMNIKVLGASFNGKTIRITRRIRKMRQDEWQSYQNTVIRLNAEIPAVKVNNDHYKDYGIPALKTLNSMTGLDSVKKQIGDIAAYLKTMQARQEAGLSAITMGQHLVFTGNPGTGKTTVARLIGEIYRDLGVITGGQFIEVGARDLIGQFIGHTAAKVDKIVDEALDGILFIDEAYALVPKDLGRDFGPEAVATLIRHMENHRDRLVVIVAGYDEEMDHLLDTNPGMKSRFKTKIAFEDYEADELALIFEHLCEEQGYKLAPDARQNLVDLCGALHRNKGDNFGNGRTVRNVFDKAVIKQARRLSELSRKPSRRALQSFHAVDIPRIKDIEW